MSKKSKKNQDPELLKRNRQDVAKALEILFADGYVSRKMLYRENFLRGIFFGAGSLIGATLFITLILWFLSLFDQVWFLEPVINNVKDSIEQGSSLN